MLALWIAYSLAIQALMASVGIGMSAFAASDADGFDICGRASAGAPQSGDHQNPNPSPSCPFCFVAVQSAGHIALAGVTPAFPVYTGLLLAPVSDRTVNRTFIPQFRRTLGDPRAPPAISV